jgi:prophage DNA circulation protein
MSVFEELRPASFRGIPFAVRNSNITRGGKSVTHEYPNDDRRYVEPLGILKPTINLTAVISGDDYINHRDLLLEALDNANTGILVHPWYGNLRVAPKPYTVDESDTSIGECIINMIFEVADPPVNPRQTQSQLSFISSLSEQLDTNLISRIGEVFSVAKEFTRNFTAAKLKIGNLITEFNVFSNYFGTSNNTNNLNSEQNTFTDNIVSAINAPATLGTNISNLFDAANNVNSDPTAIFSGMQKIFSFGNDDVPIDFVTRETSERITNNGIINASVQTYSLIYAYQNAVQMTFDNETQLDQTRNLLELQYGNIYSGVLSEALGLTYYDVLGDDIIDLLESLRNACRLAFDQISVNTDKIAQITVNSTPATILSYQYYGNTDNADSLISLNNITDVSFISGTINILVSPDDNI